MTRRRIERKRALLSRPPCHSTPTKIDKLSARSELPSWNDTHGTLVADA
jgi:hypothetical protein